MAKYLDSVVNVASDFLFGKETFNDALEHGRFIDDFYPLPSEIDSADVEFYIPPSVARDDNLGVYVPLVQNILNFLALGSWYVVASEFDSSTALYVSSPFVFAKSVVYGLGRVVTHANRSSDSRTFDRLAGVSKGTRTKTRLPQGTLRLEYDSDGEPQEAKAADWWKEGGVFPSE